MCRHKLNFVVLFLWSLLAISACNNGSSNSQRQIQNQLQKINAIPAISLVKLQLQAAKSAITDIAFGADQFIYGDELGNIYSPVTNGKIISIPSGSYMSSPIYFLDHPYQSQSITYSTTMHTILPVNDPFGYNMLDIMLDTSYDSNNINTAVNNTTNPFVPGKTVFAGWDKEDGSNTSVVAQGLDSSGNLTNSLVGSYRGKSVNITLSSLIKTVKFMKMVYYASRVSGIGDSSLNIAMVATIGSANSSKHDALYWINGTTPQYKYSNTAMYTTNNSDEITAIDYGASQIIKVPNLSIAMPPIAVMAVYHPSTKTSDILSAQLGNVQSNATGFHSSTTYNITGKVKSIKIDSSNNYIYVMTNDSVLKFPYVLAKDKSNSQNSYFQMSNPSFVFTLNNPNDSLTALKITRNTFNTMNDKLDIASNSYDYSDQFGEFLVGTQNGNIYMGPTQNQLNLTANAYDPSVLPQTINNHAFNLYGCTMVVGQLDGNIAMECTVNVNGTNNSYSQAIPLKQAGYVSILSIGAGGGGGGGGSASRAPDGGAGGLRFITNKTYKLTDESNYNIILGMPGMGGDGGYYTGGGGGGGGATSVLDSESNVISVAEGGGGGGGSGGSGGGGGGGGGYVGGSGGSFNQYCLSIYCPLNNLNLHDGQDGETSSNDGNTGGAGGLGAANGGAGGTSISNSGGYGDSGYTNGPGAGRGVAFIPNSSVPGSGGGQAGGNYPQANEDNIFDYHYPYSFEASNNWGGEGVGGLSSAVVAGTPGSQGGYGSVLMIFSFNKLLFINPNASASNNLPGGPWSASCTAEKYNGVFLTASCTNMIGNQVSNTVKVSPSGNCNNVNGDLQCNVY